MKAMPMCMARPLARSQSSDQRAGRLVQVAPVFRNACRPVIALLAAAALLSGCHGSAPAAAGPGAGGVPGGGRGLPGFASGPVEVGFVTVSAGPQPLVQALTGRVTSSMTSDVRPQVDGLIKKRLFVEGGPVRVGQPLYEIDARSYVAARDQAAAQLENARASLKSVQARADRYRALSGISAVSRQDVDDAIAAADQAKANVHQFEANLAAAQLHVEYTRVYAPISGRIGRSAVTAGALVNANQQTALATIQQLDPIYVDITQSSTQLLALRRALALGTLLPANASVRLKLEDGSDYPGTGKIEFSEVTVDPNTGTVTLRATFPNPDQLLLPGMFVSVEVAQATLRNAVLAPQQGISRGPNGNATALVLDAGNRVVQRNVVADRAVGDKWLVTSGLNAGDRLVVEGLNKISPGALVKPAPAKLGG
jgi:membrane fusion protein (multidrug efflux system)